jgi:hypothetical protein
VCTSPFFAALVLGRLPKQLLYGDLGGTHLGSPCTNLHQPWTTSRPLFTRMLHLMGSTVTGGEDDDLPRAYLGSADSLGGM